MSKSALTVLREARELISDPKRWTTREYARNSVGKPTGPKEDDAACWCAIGALMRASDFARQDDDFDGVFMSARYALKSAARLPVNASIATFNDAASHEDVLRVFDVAIASAEKEARQ